MSVEWKTRRSPVALASWRARSFLPQRKKPTGPIGVLVRGGSELNVDFHRDGQRFTDVTLTWPGRVCFRGHD
jgi:hypothetical protein